MGKQYEAHDFIDGFNQGMAEDPRGFILAIDTIPFDV